MNIKERCMYCKQKMLYYKRKYLITRQMYTETFKQIAECSYDIDNYDGTTDTVVNINDVMYAFGNYIKELEK